MKTKLIILFVAVLLAFSSAFNAWASRDPLGGGTWINRDPMAPSVASREDEMRLGPNLYDYVENNPISFVDPLGLDRTLYFFGHAWIVVDTWDDCCRKTGSVMLDFAPRTAFGQDTSDFGIQDPGVNFYPTFMHWTLKSTCKQDKKLLEDWQTMRDYSTVKYNVFPYNCWSFAFYLFRDGM